MPIKARQGLKRASLTDQLVEALSSDIFRGELAPGELLPPIRALASQLGVTVPTAQRALSRLEQMGLVEIRQGSGMTVLDPRLHADLGCLPWWLEAMLPDPPEARRLAAELLELRRDVLVLALLRVRRFVRTRTASELNTAMDQLIELCADESASPHALMKADQGVLRGVLRLRPQRATGAVLSAYMTTIARTRPLCEAMYAEPEQHAMSYRMILDFLTSRRQDEDLQWLIDTVLTDLDNATLERFVTLLKGP